MICASCGSTIRVGAVFCGECGTKVAVAAAPLLPPPPPPPAVTHEAVTPEAVTHEAATPGGFVLGSAGMIAPPPGLFAAPPAIHEVRPPPPLPVGVGASVPVLIEPDADVDATQISVRRRTGGRWRLVLPDGKHYVVEKPVLIGRDAAANAQWPGAALLSVNDPTKSVSKTHAVLEVDQEGLWVTDLDSTNGVVVRMPDGRELESTSGERVSLLPGSDVELGDFVIQIEKD